MHGKWLLGWSGWLLGGDLPKAVCQPMSIYQDENASSLLKKKI